MSETLLAVIIGGVLGGGFSMVVLIVEHHRWKKEFKIQYLQAERRRREEQCEKIRNHFSEGLATGKWSAQLVSEWILRLPKEVGSRICKTCQGINFDQTSTEEKKNLYVEVVCILGEFMAEIDKEIEKLSR